MSWLETKSAAPRRPPSSVPGRGRDRPATPSTGDFATLRLSTEGIPEADRVAVWRDEMGPVVRLEVEALSETPFRADLAVRMLPGLGVFCGPHSPFRVTRSRHLLADGNDDLILIVRTGAAVAQLPSREVAVGSREAVLVTNGSVSSFEFSAAAEVFALSLPRAALKPLLRDIDAALLRPVPSDNNALRLLATYYPVLWDDRALASTDLRRTVVAHVYDLVALALGATSDAADLADQRGVRAARLRAVKADIADSLDRGGDLSVATVAARHRVTARSVQMLFEGEGTTFTKYVLGERLARAYRMLVDPLARGRGIAAVAFESGFGDLSYFIRTFRGAYGATPSEIREGIGRC